MKLALSYKIVVAKQQKLTIFLKVKSFFRLRVLPSKIHQGSVWSAYLVMFKANKSPINPRGDYLVQHKQRKFCFN